MASSGNKTPSDEESSVVAQCGLLVRVHGLGQALAWLQSNRTDEAANVGRGIAAAVSKATGSDLQGIEALLAAIRDRKSDFLLKATAATREYLKDL